MSQEHCTLPQHSLVVSRSCYHNKAKAARPRRLAGLPLERACSSSSLRLQSPAFPADDLARHEESSGVQQVAPRAGTHPRTSPARTASGPSRTNPSAPPWAPGGDAPHAAAAMGCVLSLVQKDYDLKELYDLEKWGAG